MERVISESDKIRRAEEIYARRRENSVRVPTSTVNRRQVKRDYKSIKKMLLQISICVLIYTAMYLIQNTNYIFSESVVNKARDVLSYNINFPQIFENIKNNKFFNFSSFNIPFLTDNEGKDNENKQNDENGNNEVNNENNVQGEDNQTQNTDQNKVEDNATGVGGSNEGNLDEGTTGVGGSGENKTLGATDGTVYYEEVSSYNQMKLDGEEIKNKYQLQLPLKGEITSKFGLRQIEPKFHSGIDIATNTGVDIVSAIDGKVTLHSLTGDYGQHLKIENGELTTLYAHCSKLLVKEGDEIKKGQKIAQVGATGNATGPHLHFEVIYSGRIVNPEYVMQF